MEKAKKRVIGITGGVGSGKTSVLTVLRERYGAYLLVADEIAKEMMRPHGETYDALLSYFGPGILDQDQTIDKKKMAEEIFLKGLGTETVNAIVHPLVMKRIRQEICDYSGSLIVLEAALLFEAEADKLCDEVWFVDVPEEERIRRLMESRGYSREKCLSIMKQQMSREAFVEKSDRVLFNGGGTEERDAAIDYLIHHPVERKEKVKSMTVKEQAHNMKLASPFLASCDIAVRNQVLLAIADTLVAHKEVIFETNHEDLARAQKDGVSAAVMKRLKFDEGKLSSAVEGLRQLASLPDPIGEVLLQRELDTDLVLTRVSVPIGVIGVIFEARPDAMIQISALCLKSGNCAILKGGRETAKTNELLFSLIKGCAKQCGLPEDCLFMVSGHSEVDELLACEKDVDLLIPRGSNAFVQYIMNHTKIPVMGHADGVCHIYVDKACDRALVLPVLLDAKTQYTAACNAVETILIDRNAKDELLPLICDGLSEAGIKLRGTKEVEESLAALGREELSFEVMGEEEFHTEYLELVVSLKLVDGVKEAVNHINAFGSHHTDAILTQDAEAEAYFSRMVDSAGVYVNCSTRFADGFRYGFGAEVGISTSKLHARGPVGLSGLVTYKYLLKGNGQRVGQYASGEKQFHFKDLH